MENANNKKILIVDDEVDLRSLLKDMLQAGGYQTDEAEDGLAALQKLQSQKYDLVLLDLMMPKLHGMEALRRIRSDEEKYGKMPIVILTNLASDIAIKESYSEKADGYLIKTQLTPEQVLTEVDTIFKEFAERQQTQKADVEENIN